MGETRRSHQNRQQWRPINKDGNGNPPLPSSSSSSSSGLRPVPRWERDFCTLECSIPWKKLCEAKRFMHLYDNVVNWDDSEGRDAFHNAKSRYFARSHGLPCDLPLPDPNTYIDAVDNDDEDGGDFADAELAEELRRPWISDEEKEEEEEETVIDCNLVSLIRIEDIVPTGWGDDERGDAEKSKEGCCNGSMQWHNWEDSRYAKRRSRRGRGGAR